MKVICVVMLLLALSVAHPSNATIADSVSRSLTMQEYEKAKTFTVKNLDKDTYVKFENAYVLDRYESKKPYFITGDDSLRKRIDLYKLIAKDGMQELGVMIFYTNEKGKLYKAVLPGLNADGKIWERYFEDIHSIDKEEKNFVLKLSYVLSKEFSFQLYKAEGKPLSKDEATYGNDICFPGDNEVTMADGSTKMLQDIQAGDEVLTVNPITNQTTTTTVTALTQHAPKNYAITELLLMQANQTEQNDGNYITMHSKVLKATPNHPVKTFNGIKHAGDIKTGDEIWCLDEQSHRYEKYTVWNTQQQAGGVQKVYNIIANSGETFIMNDVMVMQKMQE